MKTAARIIYILLGLMLFGYLEIMAFELALGIPTSNAALGSALRAGVTMVLNTMIALPKLLYEGIGDVRRLRDVVFAGVTYAAVVVWLAPRSWLRLRVRRQQGAAVDAAAVALAVLLFMFAIHLLLTSAESLWVRQLLAEPRAAESLLAAKARAGRSDQLTHHYFVHLSSLALSGHVAWLLLHYEKQRLIRRWAYRLVVWSTLATAYVLMLVAICLPSSYALVRVTGSFPTATITLAEVAGKTKTVSGLMVTEDDRWLVIFQPERRALARVAVAAVQEVEFGGRRLLFPLARRTVSPL